MRSDRELKQTTYTLRKAKEMYENPEWMGTCNTRREVQKQLCNTRREVQKQLQELPRNHRFVITFGTFLSSWDHPGRIWEPRGYQVDSRDHFWTIFGGFWCPLGITFGHFWSPDWQNGLSGTPLRRFWGRP